MPALTVSIQEPLDKNVPVKIPLPKLLRSAVGIGIVFCAFWSVVTIKTLVTVSILLFQQLSTELTVIGVLLVRVNTPVPPMVIAGVEVIELAAPEPEKTAELMTEISPPV